MYAGVLSFTAVNKFTKLDSLMSDAHTRLHVLEQKNNSLSYILSNTKNLYAHEQNLTDQGYISPDDIYVQFVLPPLSNSDSSQLKKIFFSHKKSWSGFTMSILIIIISCLLLLFQKNLQKKLHISDHNPDTH